MKLRLTYMHLLYEPEFSTVTPLMVLVSSVSIHDLPNLNFSVFCEAFLKFSKFCQPYDNIRRKKAIILFGWSRNFSSTR